MRKVLLLLAVISFLGISSCKKDSNDGVTCNALWAIEILDEYSALSDASMEYGEDPSPANCVAYKEACQDYVDAMEPYLECEDLEEEVQEAIDEMQADIDELDCEE